MPRRRRWIYFCEKLGLIAMARPSGCWKRKTFANWGRIDTEAWFWEGIFAKETGWGFREGRRSDDSHDLKNRLKWNLKALEIGTLIGMRDPLDILTFRRRG
ncbi:MAG: hypothetical protein N3G78_00325 [Desulfobacterota bacterium]|nr:hypothetical protein [Thermodesulfobacteriota bacterium]